MATCQHCGAPLDSNSRICRNCGRPYQEASQAEPKQSLVAPIAIGVSLALVVTLVAILLVPRLTGRDKDAPEEPSSVEQAKDDEQDQEKTDQAEEPAEEVEPDEPEEEPAAQPSEPTPAPAPATRDYNATEGPTLEDFGWLTGEAAMGYVPAGYEQIHDYSRLIGSWKGYFYGDDTEHFCSVYLDEGQFNEVITVDWIWVFIGSEGEGYDDNTPDSTFSGEWDGSGISATGPGNFSIAAAWTDGSYQYATGSLLWPSGEVSNVTLVRP